MSEVQDLHFRMSLRQIAVPVRSRLIWNLWLSPADSLLNWYGRMVSLRNSLYNWYIYFKNCLLIEIIPSIEDGANM